MELNFAELIKKHGINAKGIIQLGSHYFEEKEIFKSIGVNSFVLVEPQKHAYEEIKRKIYDVNALTFNCAVSNYEGISEMFCDNVNHGNSSSLFKPKEHLKQYPSIPFDRKELVNIRRLENIPFDRHKYNVLVMDLQGGELKALLGAGSLLLYIDAIYAEVNLIEMYEGCVLLPQLDHYLGARDFERVAIGHDNGKGWTDAFYVKKND